MKILDTKIPGVYSIEAFNFHDERGSFIKTFHKTTFLEKGMDVVFDESFYSISKKDVIRGMHFQIPPEDHSKLIYVPHGAITDVVLDIRKGSPTYGEYCSFELSADNHMMVYIPKGCAHGFISRQDGSCTVYLQSTMRSAECETGIKADSFGMEWGASQPIISTRDQAFMTLKDFNSPFIFQK